MVYFKKSTSQNEEKTQWKRNQRNRVLNLKFLEALEVVELMELIEPVREAVLNETCVLTCIACNQVKHI